MNKRYKIFAIFFVIFFAVAFSPRFLHAAIKDSDVDGLSDDAEKATYQTDPQMFDTDGDGRGDGDEILDGTDPLDKDSSLLATLIRPDPGLLGGSEKLAWYIGRASGILAFVLFTWVVAFGLIISSRSFTGVILGATAYEIHRFISWLALGTVILHFSSFLFDNFMKMKIVEALVPFVMTRSFQTTLGYDIGITTALGVISFYLVLILVFTSEWRSKMSPKLWRGIHYVSAVGYVLFVLHGLGTGTDSKEWWMQALYATSVSIVTLLVLVRIFGRNLIPMWRNFRRDKSNAGTLSSQGSEPVANNSTPAVSQGTSNEKDVLGDILSEKIQPTENNLPSGN